MYITWSDLIRIAKEMFAMNQKELAEFLDVKASEISRVETKKYDHLTAYTLDKLFEKLFIPTNTLKRAEEEIRFFSLEKAIEKVGRKEVMKDYWKGEDEHYETGYYGIFVEVMQSRVIGNHDTTHLNEIDFVDDFVMPNEEGSTPAAERNDEMIALLSAPYDPGSDLDYSDEYVIVIYNEFKKNVEKYQIVEYLYDKTPIFDKILDDKIHNFRETIERKIIEPYNKNKKEEEDFIFRYRDRPKIGRQHEEYIFKLYRRNIKEAPIVHKIDIFLNRLVENYCDSKSIFANYAVCFEKTKIHRDEIISLLLEIYNGNNLSVEPSPEAVESEPC